MRDKYLVCFEDAQGLPRSWAVSTDQAEAVTEATRQLGVYVAKKRLLGDVISSLDFHRTIQRIDNSVKQVTGF